MDDFTLDLSSPPDWRPLERLCRLLEERSELPAGSAGDFMYMGRLIGTARCSIHLYKHHTTRAYLCLDSCGHAYMPKAGRGDISARPAQDLLSMVRRVIAAR